MAKPEQEQQLEGAMIQAASKAGFFQLLGLSIEKIDGGLGHVSVSVDERLMHPYMMVHGGVLFTLADTAMSMALMSLIPPGTPFSTIEAKINYLRPVKEGKLIAEAMVVHQGRSTAVLEASIYNEINGERTLAARALGTFHIARDKQAEVNIYE